MSAIHGTAWCRNLFRLFSVALLAGSADIAAAGSSCTAGFVCAAGTKLVVNGSPWLAAGYNQYQLMNLGTAYHVCGDVYSNTQVSDWMDQAQAAGATVVRTWFFQDYYRKGPSGNKWAAFDRVLAQAAKRNLKVIPALANYQDDCEAPNKEKLIDFYQTWYKTSSATNPYQPAGAKRTRNGQFL